MYEVLVSCLVLVKETNKMKNSLPFISTLWLSKDDGFRIVSLSDWIFFVFLPHNIFCSFIGRRTDTTGFKSLVTLERNFDVVLFRSEYTTSCEHSKCPSENPRSLQKSCIEMSNRCSGICS